MPEPISTRELVYRQRRSNVAGKLIPLHHSLASMRLSRAILLTCIGIPIITDALLWLLLEPILHLWNMFFQFWVPMLAPDHGQVGFQAISFFGFDFQMPFPAFHAEVPSKLVIGINFIVTSVLLLISLESSKRMLPLAYYVRLIALIQFSASVFFLVRPNSFPYSLNGYVGSQLGLGLHVLFLLSPLLALIYYPLNFSPQRKITLTLLVIGYFIIALPFQYLMHAYLISSWTFLFLPVLYLLFGALLDVLMFIGLYSWGMTWKTTPEDTQMLPKRGSV